MKAIKASYCVRAIKNLSKCQKGREALYHAGLSDILYDLINSNEEQIITNALYIFNHCAKNVIFKYFVLYVACALDNILLIKKFNLSKIKFC